MIDFERMNNMVKSLKNIAKDIEEIKNDIEIQRADGCEGCAYMDVEEWNLPCCNCKRGCKDYWRKGENT